jgi:hypothetical protein
MEAQDVRYHLPSIFQKVGAYLGEPFGYSPKMNVNELGFDGKIQVGLKLGRIRSIDVSVQATGDVEVGCFSGDVDIDSEKGNVYSIIGNNVRINRGKKVDVGVPRGNVYIGKCDSADVQNPSGNVEIFVCNGDARIGGTRGKEATIRSAGGNAFIGWVYDGSAKILSSGGDAEIRHAKVARIENCNGDLAKIGQTEEGAFISGALGNAEVFYAKGLVDIRAVKGRVYVNECDGSVFIQNSGSALVEESEEVYFSKVHDAEYYKTGILKTNEFTHIENLTLGNTGKIVFDGGYIENLVLPAGVKIGDIEIKGQPAIGKFTYDGESLGDIETINRELDPSLPLMFRVAVLNGMKKYNELFR